MGHEHFYVFSFTFSLNQAFTNTGLILACQKQDSICHMTGPLVSFQHWFTVGTYAGNVNHMIDPNVQLPLLDQCWHMVAFSQYWFTSVKNITIGRRFTNTGLINIVTYSGLVRHSFYREPRSALEYPLSALPLIKCKC